MSLSIRGSNSILILILIAFLSYPLCSGVEGKEYLSGAIVIDKVNDDQIQMISVNFKDNPYHITTRCNLIAKPIIQQSYPDIMRTVYERENYKDEEIEISDGYSWFVANIRKASEISRREYINRLVGEIDSSYTTSGYRELAAHRNTTGITFYPKTIDGRFCTALEYTGDNDKTYYKLHEPSNVVGLFMPLNETKDGCDKYLVLYSINQTADWLDSVKVSVEKGIQ